ncbi:transmembrane protein, putative (macronuclear) [Tetrahymena thermophila SB210]|uniref:Transmembrane protein, putative n=1 Tax=Tetrahymena thermophila (strain SB210) TaxID=312017 RepID=I7M0F2_TETTS|nr:transmembrane protein, putative [Tetrahymena thermophila SB210]EAR87459.2 transmembrane protein, putative [Tetrahymena thermophila SB210]|eukprot:XP_001007704.2 transmembrane protein, putative [Tetrahymena thermophila SB210]
MYLVDYYLRSIYNSVELDFDKYLCSGSSIFLEHISLQHQMYCQKPQFCFCSTKVDEKDKYKRSELVYEYIERYFEVELENIKKLSFLHVSYLAFLLDVQMNFNKFFVKANQIMRKCDSQILYLKSIKLLVQIGILFKKGALFQKNNQNPQNIQFIEILEFDDKINQCFLYSKQFLDQKKQLLQDIGQDYFDLNKANSDLLKLFHFRQEIYISLQQLIKKQISNNQLNFLIDVYENYLSPETQLSQLLIRLNKKNILNQKSHNFQIDGKKCYAFISLSENRGQVIKISNNFDQIVPNTSNKDVIGKNINFMQPSSIAKVHDAILNNYLTKFQSKNSSMHLNPIIGVDKDNWAIPYQIKLQTCQLATYNYGVCAQINLIEDCNQYILIDQAKNYEIITVSNSFYKQILEQSVGKQTVSHLKISQIIPCLPDMYLNIKESQTIKKNINCDNFTTVMIKPQGKNQLDWMKNPILDDVSDSNFLELDIYAIKGEMSSIENQFLHLIQLKIFEIVQIQEIHEKIEQLQNVFSILKKRQIQKSSFSNIVMSLEQIYPQQSRQSQSDNIFNSYKNSNNNTLTDQYAKQIQEQSEYSDELPLERQLNQRIEAQNTLDTKLQTFSPLNRFRVTQGDDYLNENNLELTRVTQILSPQNSFVALNSKQFYQLNSTDRELSITSRNQAEQLTLLNKKRFSKQKSNLQNEFNTFNSLKQKSLTLNYYIENHKSKNNIQKQQEQDQNNQIAQFNKKQEAKTNKQNFKAAGSLQSFNSHSSSRKNILTNIKQIDKFLGLLLVRVLGILGLVTFLVVTLVYFLTLNKQLENQKDDYSNLTWSSHLQSPIAEIITDNVFSRTFFLPFLVIPQQKQVQLSKDIDYELRINYNNTKASIEKYMKSDKSTTQLYNIVLNENIDYTFLQSMTLYDIHSVNFGYALEMIYALSFQVVNGLDTTTLNLIQIGLNLVSISEALTRFKTQAGDQRQKILSLFATISPQNIAYMLANIADCQNLMEKNSKNFDQKKKLSSKNLNNQTEQKSVSQFNQGILVQKRKNISITNHIPYFSFKVVLLSLFFFVLAQFGSVTNYILVNNFIEEEKANREFIGDLMNVYEFCITTSTLRIPLIIYKLQDNLSQTYIDLINQKLQMADGILKTMYDLVNKVYNDKRYEQQSFKNFVMQALQDDSCLVIQQNLNLLDNPQFSLELCNSIANGVFQQGLIQVVKLHTDLYSQRSPEILKSDMQNFFEMIIRQEQDLSETDHFYLRIYLEYVIECIESKITQITYDHYDYMIKMNQIIFSVSVIAFLFLIYISFFKFFEYSIGQIRQSKLLLNLLDIKAIEDNQYILTYLQIQR